MTLEPNDIRMIVDDCLERWFRRILALVLGTAVIAFITYKVLGVSVIVSVIAGIVTVAVCDHYRELWQEHKEVQSIRKFLYGPTTWRARAKVILEIMLGLILIGGLIYLWVTYSLGDLVDLFRTPRNPFR